MTIDEAIMQCEEAAEDRAKLSKRYDDASGYSRSHNEAIRTNDAKECEKCSQDFRQLAEWLRELKVLKAEPCEDAISREAAIETILTRVPDWCGGYEGGNLIGRNETASYIRNLPSVAPERKTGEILTDYAIGIDREGFERKFVNTRYCSLCKCDLGYNADILTHYCPNCGAKLENPE